MGDVTINKVVVKIPQAQDSVCPKCGKVTQRQFFFTDGGVQFGCLSGHEFVSWIVKPKELEMVEADLVGLLLAWNYGNVPQCLEVVKKGTMLTVVDEVLLKEENKK
jgi:hypothetical protein